MALSAGETVLRALATDGETFYGRFGAAEAEADAASDERTESLKNQRLALLDTLTGIVAKARELMRLPLDARRPEIRIAFVHSVLGTDVVDRYRFTPRPVLVEEEFTGQGYGLPDGPGPGERWQPLPDGRVRLSLHRPVDPLVVLALPSQRMRILHPDGDLLLGRLGVTRVRLRAEGCPSALSAASALPASSSPSSGSTATTSSALSSPPAPSSPPAHASKLPR